MLEHANWWFGPVVSLGIVLLGLAVSWGKYGTKISNNCKELAELKRKVETMTEQCGSIVGTSQCAENQRGCSKSLEKKLDEQSKGLHGRIDSVLTGVNAHMIKISEFMGKVNAHLDNGNGNGKTPT